jgi:L-amino acid N-acyltransferase
MDFAIRDALHADAAGILPIYNHAALNTTAIWNDNPSDLAQREAWLADRRARGYPVLVAEAAGTILGFAAFGDYRPFDGYRHTVENSVYVGAATQGKGIGRALLTALIQRARTLDKHVMVAAIESSNAASIRLHASLDFEEVARMPQVGCKFGRWLDLVIMQRFLDDAATPPA